MSLLWVRAALNPGLDHLYGSNDMNALFHGGSPTRSIPWEQGSRLKTHHDYDADVAQHAIHHPHEHMDEVDPRTLHGMQPAVTRQGLHYYMHDNAWREHGKTFRDQEQAGNRHPVIYTRSPNPNNPRAGSESLILSGHHRAAAALLRGEPLKAVHVHGPWGDRR